jgi:hypothetical protein
MERKYRGKIRQLFLYALARQLFSDKPPDLAAKEPLVVSVNYPVGGTADLAFYQRTRKHRNRQQHAHYQC